MNESQIDLYLLNLLNAEDKVAFETRLENDANLKQEISERREVLKDIEGIGRLELKSKLKNIHNELYHDSSNSHTKFRKLFFRIAVAAAFIGVLMIGKWSLQQSPNNAELFSQNFEPYELSLIQRSEGNVLFDKIENLYVEGKYEQAIPLFQDVLENSEVQSSQFLLGLGISYLETNQPKMAIAQFDQIIESKDFNYEDEAQWYLSLSYLKCDKIDEASTHLNLLAADPKRDHHKEAKMLLSQLSK